MNKLLIIALTLLSFGVRAQGIDFQHLTYSEALEKANKEDKMLFVDCYTTWCGPCKFMDKDIFVKPEVGAYFNQNFVSIKFDMESEFAREFRDMYHVSSFPTFFYIAKDGAVVAVSHGAVTEADKWLALVKEKTDKANSLVTYKNAYLKGRKAEDYKRYFDLLKKSRFEEGMIELFMDSFNVAENKFDFLEQNAGTVANNLSKKNIDKFLLQLRAHKEYVEDMDYFFENLITK